MIKTREGTGFTTKLLLCLLQHDIIGAKVGLDFLYGAETSLEANVFRPIDGTHPPLTDGGQYTITISQQCPGFQQL